MIFSFRSRIRKDLDISTKRVTLKDVAEAANVSLMTVSNVVNNRTEFVSERTRAVVQREIDRLNYKTSGSARALRTGKTNSVGVLLVEPSSSDPFGAREIDMLFRSFAQRMSEQRFNLALRTTTPANLEQNLFEFAPLLDGLFILSHCETIDIERLYPLLNQLDKPTVMFGNPTSHIDKHLPIAWVDDNSKAAAESLTRRLIGMGIHRFAIMESNFVSYSVAQRIEAMRTEAQSRDMTTVGLRIPRAGSDFSKDLSALIDPRTCLVALNELQAQSILIGLMSNGYCVPKDVQLVCLNLTPTAPSVLARAMPYFGITGIQSDARGLGNAAASLLLTHLKYGKFSYKTVAVDCEVTEATTTGLVTIRENKVVSVNLAS